MNSPIIRMAIVLALGTGPFFLAPAAEPGPVLQLGKGAPAMPVAGQKVNLPARVDLGGIAPALAPVGALGNFELDGDAEDSDAVLGDDWKKVLLQGGGSSYENTGLLRDFASDTIFNGGGSKDYNDLDQWRHKGGTPPDKDNLTHAYAASYTVNNELVIYFGADRYSNLGDAMIGFWFFQEEVKADPNGTFTDSKGKLAKHSIGDLLVLANFTNGGQTTNIQVLKWVGTGGDQHQGTIQLIKSASAECGAAGGIPYACAITNHSVVTAPWDDYIAKDGTKGSFPVESFFEGGVNITDLLGTASVPCFSSFLAETRSSDSVPAVLKDFVIGKFKVCKMAVDVTCTPPGNGCRLNASQTAYVYPFSGTVTNQGFGTLYDVTVEVTTSDPTVEPFDFDLGDIPAGGTKSFGDEFESLQSPPTISASASAAGSSGGDPIITAIAPDSKCSRCPANPKIHVTKQCSVALVVDEACGKVVVEVSYSGQVCNNGDIRLENVIVTDDAGTPDDLSDDGDPVDIGDLAVGDCADYSGKYRPKSVNSSNPALVSFTDTVTAEGDEPLFAGDEHVSDTETATCKLCPACP
jgi:hypothetical protein